MTMQERRRMLADFVLALDDATTERFFKEAVCGLDSGEIKQTKELLDKNGNPSDIAAQIFGALKSAKNAQYLAGCLYEEVFILDSDFEDLNMDFAQTLLLNYHKGYRFVNMMLDYLADVTEYLERLDDFVK